MKDTISFAAFATLSVLFRTAKLRDLRPDEPSDDPAAFQHATNYLKDYLKARYPNAKLEALKVPNVALCSSTPDLACLQTRPATRREHCTLAQSL